ncbi:hypothetical protein DSM104299_00800 [Baekduia alba]|uniref:hypothetical protein n=1 Tax=Baekduia alba TaxID=2997333 RepID=UPI002340CD2E|nr:hypothetical protein [Baekduia alba]WCB92115.1 hypothetical protein DSM104299_00800 [Baekduia alba]
MPVGGALLIACGAFALTGFPLDDFWHRMFGQDVTLWGPTHLVMINGAILSVPVLAVLALEARRARRAGEEAPDAAAPDLAPRSLSLAEQIVRTLLPAARLFAIAFWATEFDWGVPQYRVVWHPLLLALAGGLALTTGRIVLGRGDAVRVLLVYLLIRGAAGLLCGTVGFAAQYAWTQVWAPVPWTPSLLGEGLPTAVLAGLAGGLLGGLLGAGLRRELPARAVRRRVGVGAAALLVVLGANALWTSNPDTLTLTPVAGKADAAHRDRDRPLQRRRPRQARADAPGARVAGRQPRLAPARRGRARRLPHRRPGPALRRLQDEPAAAIRPGLRGAAAAPAARAVDPDARRHPPGAVHRAVRERRRGDADRAARLRARLAVDAGDAGGARTPDRHLDGPGRVPTHMTPRPLAAALIATTALAASAATAAIAAQAPTFHLVGQPILYTIKAPRLGGPSAYVVFAGDRHLHEPRQVVAQVAGHTGRTYLVSDRCYRSAIVNETAAGRPQPVVKAGNTYTITFSVRPGATGKKTRIGTRRLVARTWASAKTPRC